MDAAAARASTSADKIPIRRKRFGGAEGTSRCRAEAARVDEQRPQKNSTNAPCRSCGSDERTRVSRDVKAAGSTFQVIVACATCGHAFAALSRN
jgi:DNA-directed RNA polymerase subunit M/transcription elongation factor TFIIS